MNGKITDIGWYATNHLEPISKGGRSEKFNLNRPIKKSYLDRQTDPMQSLYSFVGGYQLKGIEFGNWITQDERRAFVPALNTTLIELGNIMHSYNIGFDHNIGIALGARGVRGALAHYEPVLNMINLTREKGEGTLAHEYGHALDYNFGAFVDQNKQYNALSGGSKSDKTLPLNTGGQLRALVNNILDSICNGKNYPLYVKYDRISGKNYLTQRTEMFARFFEQYVAYLYKEKGMTNKLLCRTYDYYTSSPAKCNYVAHEDFLRIKPVADKLIKEFSNFLNGKRGISLTPTPYPKKLAIPAKPEVKAPSNEIPISYKDYLIIRQAIIIAGKCDDENKYTFFTPMHDKFKNQKPAVYVAYGRTANKLSEQWLNRGNGMTWSVKYVYMSRPDKKTKMCTRVEIPAIYCDEVKLHEMCVNNKQCITLYDGARFLNEWHPAVDKPAAKKQTAKTTKPAILKPTPNNRKRPKYHDDPNEIPLF